MKIVNNENIHSLSDILLRLAHDCIDSEVNLYSTLRCFFPIQSENVILSNALGRLKAHTHTPTFAE